MSQSHQRPLRGQAQATALGGRASAGGIAPKRVNRKVGGARRGAAAAADAHYEEERSVALPRQEAPARTFAAQSVCRPLCNSFALWERARRVIPCGTQTLSKAPSQFIYGVYPIYIARGLGSRVFDVDGNVYIDYPMGLGAILLGHAYPPVVEAICTQASRGSVFTLMHPLEVELAECLCEIIPCAEMVRFAKNGSDVTAAAVRLARAVTGREKVAYCGYHGWQDWYAATTTMKDGVPAALRSLALPFQYNRIETLEAIFEENRGEVAAVIFEQGGEEPRDGFLQKVAELTRSEGALLIWDEIVTGFRYALGGAQQYYGVTPDLACFGKGLANGMPLAALVGRRDLMKEFDRVFFSMTFGGESLSLAAALATVGEIRSRDVIKYLWQLGEYWKQGFERLGRGTSVPVSLSGVPPRTGFVFGPACGYEPREIRSLFLQECVKRGVLFGVPIFISFSHSPRDIELTLDVASQALAVVERAIKAGDLQSRMEGEMAGEVFRSQNQGAASARKAPAEVAH